MINKWKSDEGKILLTLVLVHWFISTNFYCFLSEIEVEFDCHGCGESLGCLFGQPRFCHLTGKNYCKNCHVGDEAIIPARVFHHWDFQKYKVCETSKSMLGFNYYEPLIDVDGLFPKAEESLKELHDILETRRKLLRISDVVLKCARNDAHKLRAVVWPKEYVFESSSKFSMSDLDDMQNKKYIKMLNKVMKCCTRHVRWCNLCTSLTKAPVNTKTTIWPTKKDAFIY